MASDNRLPKAQLIVLAAGQGSRLKSEIPKQLLPLMRVVPHSTLLDLVLYAYQKLEAITEIIVVFNPEFEKQIREVSSEYSKVTTFVVGGKTRQESALFGIRAATSEYILLHDAARPLVLSSAVTGCLEKLAAGYKAVNTVMIPPVSMVQVRDEEMVGSLPRGQVAHGQCPQAFHRETLLAAQEAAVRKGLETHDECSAILQLTQEKVATVPGHPAGMKVTFPNELNLLRFYFQQEDPNS